MRLHLLTLAVTLALTPALAGAEAGALLIGGVAEGLDLAPLRAAARSLLERQGLELQDTSALSAELDDEPLPSEIARWSGQLSVERLFVIVVNDGDGDALRLHLSVYEAGPRRLASLLRQSSAESLVEDLTRELEQLTSGQPEAPTPLDTTEEVSAVPVVTDEELPPPPPPPQPRSRGSEGRAQLAINATVLGLTVMAGVLFAADVQDPRLFAPILLVGGAGGLTTALLLNRRWPISRGDNSILAAGGWYGASTGLLIAGAAGFFDLRWLMTGALVGELLGLASAITAAAFTEITVGDGAVLHSSAIWGLFSGGVLATLVWHDDPRASFGMILAGLGLGLGVGALLTHLIEISAGRATVIDLCGLLGVLLGASVGIPIIVDEQGPGQLRAYAGILLGAAAAGIGIGVLLTRRWDEGHRQEQRRRRPRRSSQISLLLRPTVIPPSPSLSRSRAVLGVQLVGGSW